MLNSLTSPTEVMNAAITSTKPQPSSSTSTTSSTKTTNEEQNQNSSKISEKALTSSASFDFTGVHLCVPYKITVNIDSTADPNGAKTHAQKVIEEIFQLAKTCFSQDSSLPMTSEIVKINNDISKSSFDISDSLENLLLQAQEVCRGTDNIFFPVTFLTTTSTSNDEKETGIATKWDDCFELKINNTTIINSDDVTKEEKGGASAGAGSFYKLIKKNPKAQLDLYGISKGWIVDAMCSALISSGFSGVMVDWGGDIKCQGNICNDDDDDDGKKQQDRDGSSCTSWKIGLEKATSSSSSTNTTAAPSVVKTISLCDSACATSGSYKQQQSSGKQHLRFHEPSEERRRNREEEQQDEKNNSRNNQTSSVLASVTVVHPSASTADALATFFFCYLSNVEMKLNQQDADTTTTTTNNNNRKQALEAELFRYCDEKTNQGREARTTATWFGNELSQVIVQWWDSNHEEKETLSSTWTNKLLHQHDEEKNNKKSSSSIIKQAHLQLNRASVIGGTADKFDKEITDTFRRSLQRMVAIVFIRIDSTFLLGCTLSSGSLLSSKYFNCSVKMKDQLIQNNNQFDQNDPQNNNNNIHAFTFSAMKNSRLYNLMVSAVSAAASNNNQKNHQEIWLMLPRVMINNSNSNSNTSSTSASQRQLSIMANFAGGKMITFKELEHLSGDFSTEPNNKNPIFRCPIEKAPAHQMHSCNFTCGDHGVFTLPVNLSTDSSSILPPTTSVAILRVGRNYATLCSSASSTTLLPRLSASAKKTVHEQLMNPICPSTCGIFTRIASGNKFFGVTCSNIEFISTSTEYSYSPVIQLLCPMNELTVASLSDILNPQQQKSQSGGNNSKNYRLKLHIFGEHPDAHSLLKWFADASFMNASGTSSEHFMYLPSASDHEDAERYTFPGTAGKGGALYTFNCNIVFVDKVSPGVLALFAQVTGTKKFGGEDSSVKPTFWWN